MKKIISVFFITIFLLLFSFISVVSATIVPLYSRTGTGLAVQPYIQTFYPSGDSYGSGYASCFTASASGYLTSVNIRVMGVVGGVVGNFTAYLKGVSGSISSDNAVPNATVFSTATNFISGTFDGSYDSVTLLFDGDYEIISGKDYAFCFEAIIITPDKTSLKWVTVEFNSDDAAGDTPSSYHNSGWVVDDSSVSLGMTVYGVGTATPTPTSSPSPVGSVTVRPSSVPVASVPSYYMVVLVLFAVVAVLAGIYVGFSRDGGNKGVAFLFALVALVIFVVLIVGYLVG